jgi:hypothetical protein
LKQLAAKAEEVNIKIEQLLNSTADLLEPVDKVGYEYSQWPDQTSIVPLHKMKDINEFVRAIDFDKVFTKLYCEYAPTNKVTLIFYIQLNMGCYYSPLVVQIKDVPLLHDMVQPNSETFKDMVLNMYQEELDNLKCYFPVMEEPCTIQGIQRLEIFQQPV